MRAFELFRPASLDEATEKASEKALFKAGGIDLLDRLKERIAAPQTLIDLWALRPQMRAIAVQGDEIAVGALATLAQVATAVPLQRDACAALTQAAGDAATPQVRSRATVGGNLLQMARCWYLRSARFACAHSGRGDTCLAQEGEHRYHAIMGVHDCIRVHPSNLAPPLLVLGATAHVRNAKGETRTLPLRALWPEEPTAEAAEHTLAPDEVLTEVRFPVPPAGTRSAYRESREKQAHDWATTAAAVRLRLDGGRIADPAICLGAVAPVPLVAERAAAVLQGEKPTAKLFEKVAETAYASADPFPQNTYKVAVGKAVLIDALAAAAGTK